MVQITPRAHRQTLGDPPHCHRRLRTQARRQSHFHWIPLGPSFEISFMPPPPLQLLRDDQFRQRPRRLRALTNSAGPELSKGLRNLDGFLTRF